MRAGLNPDMMSVYQAYCFALTIPRTSVFWSVVSGIGSEYTIEREIGFQIIDRLNAMLWQNGGGKKNKPKPTPRPYEMPDNKSTEKTVIKGSAVVPIETILKSRGL